MNEHAHPHGIEDLEPNSERVWMCECGAAFADEEIRRYAATSEWGHPCRAKRRNELGRRCEGHLDPFMPSVTKKETP